MESQSEIKKDNRPFVRFQGKPLTATQCIRGMLGDRIDFTWNMEQAVMEVSPSKMDHFEHKTAEKEEHFLGVPFRHSDTCPFLDKNLAPNNQSVVRPCVVVLIQNKNTKKILATQRHEKMSFGNQWVLPGGHLERGQKVLQGGLRECQEEVGIKPENVILDFEKADLMVWQSVLVDQKEKKIKRAAMVVFFRIECEDFQVVEQKSEVKSWEWRSFGVDEDPWGGGWALGHLFYLRHLVEENKLK